MINDSLNIGQPVIKAGTLNIWTINIDTTMITKKFTFDPNTTENEVLIGSASLIDGAQILFTSKRGNKIESGVLTINNSGAEPFADSPGYRLSLDEDGTGIELSAKLNQGNLSLIVACDNSDSNTTAFKCNIITIKK